MESPDPKNPAPGDAIITGSAGIGENICPECNGAGEIDGAPCAYCNGHGIILEGIAGA